MKSLEPQANGTQAGFFTAHPQFDSNFTLEKGSNDNTLPMHVKFPSLSDDTVHNIKDSLSSFDLCGYLIWLSSLVVDGRPLKGTSYFFLLFQFLT